jgi:hypothetical protein
MSFCCLTLRHFAWLSLALAAAAGCGPEDKIVTYTVPKPELIDPTLVQAGANQREQQMLGAIVLADEVGWFFKLVGDPPVVGKLNDAFVKFVTEADLTGSEPKWELPAGWKQLPGNEFRFATIEIPAGEANAKPLELSVSSLPRRPGEPAEEYTLVNLNRWRGQLGLGEIEAEQLSDYTVKSKVSGLDAWLVNMQGTGSGTMGGPFAGGGAGGPFAGGASPAGPVASASPAATSGASAQSPITYEVPDGWQPGRMNQFRKAAFDIESGDEKAELTVIDLGPSPLLANVVRWAGEVGVTGVNDGNLSEYVSKTKVDGIESDLVVLIGPEDASPRLATLGAIVPRESLVWFVKLKGNAALVERERANFESFLKSLKFK